MKKLQLIHSKDGIETWPTKREIGPFWFSLIYGIKLFGGPNYIVMMAVRYYYEFGFQLTDFSSPKWNDYIWITAPVFASINLLLGLYLGDKMWDKNEATYKKFLAQNEK